ncbi:MAG: pilus assembly protein CpaD [Sphingomonadaceae bacterium]|nr:pilus assembly protein CpaD [Sphingomonadaceae bacterium]
MSRPIKLAAAAMLGLAVAGCSAQPRVLSPANNYSLYSLHQPVVEHTNFVFDVASREDGLPPAEQGRLGAWFDSIGLAYGDHVTIDGSAGTSEAARRDIAKVAGEHGLLVADDGAPMTEGAVAPGYVRIVAARATASVPHCPQWSDPGIESPVRTGSNYGCATNSNIAAMIANPDDLVHGREASALGAAITAGRAVRVYRESRPTGAQPLPSNSTTNTGH